MEPAALEGGAGALVVVVVAGGGEELRRPVRSGCRRAPRGTSFIWFVDHPVSTFSAARPAEPALRNWSSGLSTVATGAISVCPYRFHRRTWGRRRCISLSTSTGMMEAP